MIGDVNPAELALFPPSLEELFVDDHVTRLYMRVAARLDLSALEATCHEDRLRHDVIARCPFPVGESLIRHQ